MPHGKMTTAARSCLQAAVLLEVCDLSKPPDEDPLHKPGVTISQAVAPGSMRPICTVGRFGFARSKLGTDALRIAGQEVARSAGGVVRIGDATGRGTSRIILIRTRVPAALRAHLLVGWLLSVVSDSAGRAAAVLGHAASRATRVGRAATAAAAVRCRAATIASAVGRSVGAGSAAIASATAATTAATTATTAATTATSASATAAAPASPTAAATIAATSAVAATPTTAPGAAHSTTASAGGDQCRGQHSKNRSFHFASRPYLRAGVSACSVTVAYQSSNPPLLGLFAWGSNREMGLNRRQLATQGAYRLHNRQN